MNSFAVVFFSKEPAQTVQRDTLLGEVDVRDSSLCIRGLHEERGFENPTRKCTVGGAGLQQVCIQLPSLLACLLVSELCRWTLKLLKISTKTLSYQEE